MASLITFSDYDINAITPLIFELSVSSGVEYKLPTINGTAYDFTVNWGDGNIEDYTGTPTIGSPQPVSHTYTTSGTKTIKIYGKFPRIQITGAALTTFADDLRKIINWGPSGILTGVVVVSDGLTDLPSTTDGKLSDITLFKIQCPSLTTIPSDLLDGATTITSMEYGFLNCSSITSIPTGLFNDLTSVTNFKNCFTDCTSLTTVPTGLFNSCTSVTTFEGLFENCTSLTSVPSSLFRYCSSVTTFADTFYGSGLESIPSTLFYFNTAVTSFYFTFSDCLSLAGSINPILFEKNTAVTTFEGVFNNCSSIEEFNSWMFKYNTACTNFAYSFYNCSKAKAYVDVFGDNYTTRFLNKTVDFTGFWNLDTFTGDEGDAGSLPELWEYDFGTGTPNTDQTFGYFLPTSPGAWPHKFRVNADDCPLSWKI